MGGKAMSNQLLLRRRAMLGQNKEITLRGIPPITIKGKRNVLSVKAFGNCVQNGTPTPDNPIDIVCNNGVLKVNNQGNIYADGTIETITITHSGSTATAEMLLKIGNYQDIQSIIDGNITRNVGIKIFDGTENWTRGFNVDASGNRVFYCDFTDKNVGNSLPMLSTHFSYKGSASYITLVSGGFLSNASNTSVYFDGNGITTLDDWKQWLANQFIASTPLIVIYPLATPTIEQVIGQTLALTTGTNVIDITQASLQGLELEVKAKQT